MAPLSHAQADGTGGMLHMPGPSDRSQEAGDSLFKLLRARWALLGLRRSVLCRNATAQHRDFASFVASMPRHLHPSESDACGN
jgi:hypothetical protein